MRTWVHVDDLEPVLNLAQRRDLTAVLEHTPPKLRIRVTDAYLDHMLTRLQWAARAGFPERDVTQWIRKVDRLPFGAALRLARVLGVSPELLFEDYF